jgi:hypothetical protein
MSTLRCRWLNIRMETSAPWPINRYGTTWRYAMMFFDWSDEETVWQAIETLDPLKITVHDRPIAVVGFEGDGYIPLRQLIEMLEDGDDNLCVIDPCRDPDATGAKIEEEYGDTVWFQVIGIARLDIADEPTYRVLQVALDDRWERFMLDVPYIEF